MPRGAAFNPTRTHRYTLWRRWAPGPRVCFVMLNPSTADETDDDPTIRRALGFARRWGFGRLDAVNAFAYRATKPADLWRAPDPVGPDNDKAILKAARRADLVVAAWGAHAARHDRADRLRQLLQPHAPRCLGLTKRGEPRHPLYLRNDAPLRPLPCNTKERDKG